MSSIGGDKAGKQENVPGGRLRGRWADVAAYDERMANWERFGQVEITEIESSAIEQVFALLIPTEVAEWEWSPVRDATRIHNSISTRKCFDQFGTEPLTIARPIDARRRRRRSEHNVHAR